MLCLYHLPGIVSDSLVDATFAYGLFKIVLLPSLCIFVNILLITLNIIIVVVVILGVVQAHTHYSRSIKGQLSGVCLSFHSGFQESNLHAKLS